MCAKNRPDYFAKKLKEISGSVDFKNEEALKLYVVRLERTGNVEVKQSKTLLLQAVLVFLAMKLVSSKHWLNKHKLEQIASIFS